LISGFQTDSLSANIHKKAMPVILRNAVQVEQWLTDPAFEELELQIPPAR
jgi:putative SOS response-associated peptidase YedK